MDSLLASYASSDEDQDDRQPHRPLPPPPLPPQNPSKPPSRPPLFSLPPPKSSSAISFSSLPHPKPDLSSIAKSTLPRKVVQFTSPLDPSVFQDDDDDHSQNKKKEDQKNSPLKDPGKRTLASLLPPPQHSLLSSAPSGRRISVQSEPKREPRSDGGAREEAGVTGTLASVLPPPQHSLLSSAPPGRRVSVESEPQREARSDGGTREEVGVTGATEEYAGSSGVEDGAYYGSYADYGGSWDYAAYEGLQAPQPQPPPPSPPPVGSVKWKRGRNEIPTDILEVKQEELVKDRPREDQLRSTGIAFGPAYQISFVNVCETFLGSNNITSAFKIIRQPTRNKNLTRFVREGEAFEAAEEEASNWVLIL